MSILQSISTFSTGPITVTRYTGGTFLNGRRVLGTPTTLVLDASVQPATGMSRVVGGQDMQSNEDGESTPDVRQVYCATRLYARSLNPDIDPDIITFEGRQWTVFRVEEWTLRGTTFYRAVMTASTLGGA